MFNVLITGKLTKPPRPGTGKNGQPYCTASLRVPVQGAREEEPDHVFASVIAFGDDARKLGRLGQGDAVSLSGQARISQWERDERQQIGLNVTVTGILTAYQIRQRRGDASLPPTAPANPGTRKPGEPPARFDQADDFVDEISF